MLFYNKLIDNAQKYMYNQTSCILKVFVTMEVEKMEKKILLSEEDFLKWKRAYKNCKKYRSVAFKDPYDEFFKDFRELYKKYIKNVTNVSFGVITGFFVAVSEKADNYLKLDKSKKSKFYFEKREKAVKELKEESEKISAILNNKKSEIENSKKKDQDGLVQKEFNEFVDYIAKNFGIVIDVDDDNVNINTGIENCVHAIVADVPYVGVKLTSFRIYIVLTMRSSGAYRLEKICGNFSFKEYDLTGLNGKTIQNYRDHDFKSRKIFKACEIPINVNSRSAIVRKVVGNIDLKAKVYVSPNDRLSKMVFKYFDINVNEVKLEKVLLTEAEL